MTSIDLNADMGEYSNDAEHANEAALMPLITSCSIACGGHAGDVETMRATVRLAKDHGVRVGAHPSYPDRAGFGRRSIAFDLEDLASALRAQLDALNAAAIAEGVSVTHVKAHGALYNDAAKNPDLARVVAGLTGNAILVGPPGSALEAAAQEAGLRFAREGFVDRLYLASGALTPRSEHDAVIADIDARARQARAIALGEKFSAGDGDLSINADTLCVHSDSPGAVETAKAVRASLESAAISIRPFA